MRTREQRRALLEAILDDPAASHGDRLRADQALSEIEAFAGSRSSDRVELTPTEARDELMGLAAMCEAALAVHDGPDAVAPPDPTTEELLAVALEVNALLEERLTRAEIALAYRHRHRLLPAAPALEAR